MEAPSNHSSLQMVCLIASAILLMQCAHKHQRVRPPPPSVSLTTLNSVLNDDLYGMNFQSVDMASLEEQTSTLKIRTIASTGNESLVEKQKETSHAIQKRLKKTLKLQAYEKLNHAPLSSLVKALAASPKPTTEKLSNFLSAAPPCAYPELDHALGASVEDHLQEPEFEKYIFESYARAAHCETYSLNSTVALRLGLLYTLKNQPTKAQEFLKIAETTSKDKDMSIDVRSKFWLSNNSPEFALDPSALIQKFPLSYHSIIKIPDEATLPQLVSKMEANPEVRFRTDLSPEFNDDVLMLEYLLKTGKMEKAQRFISMMRTSQVSTFEPGFQLYFATLTYRAHRGLETFRIVSRFINENKIDVSPALLKMLYPLWYSDEIAQGALTSGVDPVLLTALIRQESAFDAKANSTADARGLMQMLPSTSRHFGVPKTQLFTPIRNVFVGSKFLATLLKRYDGKIHLALAAYNAGTIPVDQWVVRYPTDDPHLFMDLIPYKETREYVASILRNLSWYKALYPSFKDTSSQLSAHNSEL